MTTRARAAQTPRTSVRAICLLACLAATANADRVVTRDGTVTEGATTIDHGTKTLVAGKREIALTHVLLAEQDDGTLIYSPGFPERMRGYEVVGSRQQAGLFLALAREARAASDWHAAWVAVNRAEDAGLTSRDLAKLKRKLATLVGTHGAKQRREGSPFAKKIAALDTHFAALLAARAERALAHESDPDGLRLLREALVRAPKSKRALKLLRAAAPKDFPVRGGPRVWLDWHLDLESHGARVLREAPSPLRRARKTWRRDLHGVLGDPVLILTPVRESRVVGRCLATGKLACRILRKLFKTERPVRTPRKPLTVFLYESREEYKTTSGTGRIQDPAFLEWTAGHYSPTEGISRFFWFADPAAERRIVGTCVHELTHHWLSEHNPRTRRRSHPALPGFWIVEGFATFMEEGVYDIDTGAWSLFNPRARSLDVLQSADPRMLIAWDRFYRLTQGHFAVLPADNEMMVQLRWQLRPTIVSTRRMFYEQAAATCQFLYHGDGGKHRTRLIDFVCSYYNGRSRRLDPVKAFGLRGHELGDKTVAFAKKVAAGWRPDR